MADTIPMLGRGAQILVALGAAYLIALWFVLIVWTFRDIEARSRSVLTQIFSTLLVVLFYVPGLLLYLILRPKETLDEAFQRSLEEEYLLQDLEELPLCGSCHRYVEDDFVLCPHCRTQLREACPGCSRLVDLRWALCPYCGTSQRDQEDATERVEVPAARWSAPSLRRRRAPVEPRPVAVPEPARPVALPTPAAAPTVAEPIVAAAATEPEEKGLALVSGVRSIVRPFDRFRPRVVEDPSDEPGRGWNGRGNGPRVPGTNGNGAHDAPTTHTNGKGAAHQAHRLFDALNGKAANDGVRQAPPESPNVGSNGHANGHVNGVTPHPTNGVSRDRKPVPVAADGAATGSPRPKGEEQPAPVAGVKGKE